ncbi:MAG: hypothetical protein J1F02_02650 [Lachnospiraceae bacterium]|nr:hypothetical protein [Lachnospiraceae bacterium]
MSSKASSTCSLQNIKSGQIMTISAASACGSTGTIVVKDDSKTYATFNKTSTSEKYQYLGNASEVYTGGKNLRVEVNVAHSGLQIAIKAIVNNNNLVDSKGNTIGTVYVIAIEEWTDDDYNDYVITITATKS